MIPLPGPGAPLTQLPRIAVLGGSNPFMVVFIDALVDALARLPACQLVLHGRNSRNLNAVTEYGCRSIGSRGWLVRSTTDLEAAVDGANIVVHQIRYGGLEGRERDEMIAVDCACPADETLGPGGLHAMLRTRAAIIEVADVLATRCPSAWVLNLTNPLSLVTALMVESGVNRCVGLCELPLTTAQSAAEVLALDFSQLRWQYAGLNHRGFVVDLRHDGADQMDELARRLANRTIGGVSGAAGRQGRSPANKILSDFVRPISSAAWTRRIPRSFARADC